MIDSFLKEEIKAYYAQPGVMTDPGDFSHALQALPVGIQQLCSIVQGLMVHIFWAERYGLQLTDDRKEEVNLRGIQQKLQRIFELEEQPLVHPRPLDRRLVGNCRDFSLFLSALLQQQGVPARARCGFGTYFVAEQFIDHWVCEYWSAQQARWVMVDAQLDEFQQSRLKIDFDPLDVPPERFFTGGKAWQLCRQGQEDADKFGIFDMHGLWFVQGDLIRDFLALNKIEILPWDPWGLMTGSDTDAADFALLDRIAAFTLGGDEAFKQVRLLFEQEERLQPPPGWAP